jgi:hypothetical protein
VFAAKGMQLGGTSTTKELGHPDQTFSNTLNQNPKKVLAIEETSTSGTENGAILATMVVKLQTETFSRP